MKKKVNQVRDVLVIENELNCSRTGVLCFNDKNEFINQFAVPFLYADKNILFFYDSADEAFEKIIPDSKVRFVVLKNDKPKKNAEQENQTAYKYLQISCNGKIKEVEENKLREEYYKQYLNKYGSQITEENEVETLKLLLIDTEEIQASEVMGV
ncbi:MAG: hypothetical protein ACM3RX_02965 [Methanococcaceae archaeon]